MNVPPAILDAIRREPDHELRGHSYVNS